jgi:rhamnogalacturonyl hydrolase YesR
VVSGFFPGLLWYLYEYSNDEQIRDWAEIYSKRVEKEKYTTDNHDIGFIIFCSYGNAYRITGNEEYLDVIATAAQSLSTRYNKKIGCIRSWDHAPWNAQWQYPVIIDNMMNLELLTWSSRKFENPLWNDIAVSHANRTMTEHYRSDFSSFHVVSYDTLSGEVEHKHTSQGFSHESAWARGQSWGLYGYVMMYRETGHIEYLEHAKKVAGFLVSHPRMPEDMIPYWDYDYPGIPDTFRDVSAAAIMCSALIELSQMVEGPERTSFLEVAEKQIRALSSSYRNELGTAGNFILNHSVGHFPNGTEVDAPLTYADYYYVEALMRMKKLLATKK